MKDTIQFGTDGWRAVIADGFTFDNVKRVAQAACDVVRRSSKNRLILVGYDNRFFSYRFAETAAQVAAANGYKVEMSASSIITPVLSCQVRERKAAVGFMITASHNPAVFNGFKLKGPHGGSVDEAFTKSIEDRLDAAELQWGPDAGKKVDFIPAYLAKLKKFVNPSAANQIKGSIVLDGMHGPGGAIFEKLFGSSGKVHILRKTADPLFGGVNPEPIDQNLALLREHVLATKSVVGLAVDGDGDRIGVIDEKGRYLPPHVVMPLLLLYLLEVKKLKGKVVQAFSMGYLTQRIARHFETPFEEVPVGFKHIAKKMVEEKILLGGEESGGYGVGLWFPERDGILCAVLILEMLAKHKVPLGELVDNLEKKFGASFFKRIDVPTSDSIDKSAWSAQVAVHVGESLTGKKVRNVSTMDGIKIFLEDDSWLLMRPSGTEPLIRTYAEASAAKQTEDLLAEAQKLVQLQSLAAKKSGADGKSSRKRKVLAKK